MEDFKKAKLVLNNYNTIRGRYDMYRWRYGGPDLFKKYGSLVELCWISSKNDVFETE